MIDSVITNFPFFVAMLLVVMGAGCIAIKTNLIKIVIGLNIIGMGVNLFLVSLAYVEGGVAPLFTAAPTLQFVLSTPHALTLTNIVIGMSTTALMLSFIMVLYKHYGSVDTRTVRGLKE